MKENVFVIKEINLQELDELEYDSIIFEFSDNTTISVPINRFKQTEGYKKFIEYLNYNKKGDMK